MSEAVQDIKRWGNSLGVRLPAAIAKAAHMHADQQVRLAVVDGQIIITPIQEEFLTLEQRLARFDSSRHGGETMISAQHLGAEK